jgi:hypothetical protein
MRNKVIRGLVLINTTIIASIGSFISLGHYTTWETNPNAKYLIIPDSNLYPINHPFYGYLSIALLILATICFIVGNISLIQASGNRSIKKGGK